LRLCGVKASVNFFVMISAVRMLPDVRNGSRRVNTASWPNRDHVGLSSLEGVVVKGA
jgi:hypothetical protein